MFGLSSLTNPKIILSILSVVVVIFIVTTWILNYHWKKYSVTKAEGQRIKVVYFFVSTFLWIIVILSTIQLITEG